MTFEARLAFIAFFLFCWCVVGLIPWAISAVWVRGRGSLLAVPLALGGACALGIAVPLLGARDMGGFFLSLLMALVGGTLGSVGGIAFSRRLEAARPRAERPVVGHVIGAPRPAASESPETPTTNQ